MITPDTQIEFLDSMEADEGLTFLKFNSEFVARDLVSHVKFGGYRPQLETLEEILSIKIQE